MIKAVRTLLTFLFFFLLLTGLAIGWIINVVNKEVDSYIYLPADTIPANQVVMVLGAQVLPGQVPSRALAYRLTTAIDIWRQARANQLLMSGDGRSSDYNEVATMKEYAEKAGIPSKAIIEDPAGLHTYDSCLRAKNQYGFKKLTIVTQRDHLVRAVYTCRKLGIEAIGVVAPEFSQTNLESQTYLEYRAREIAALVLAWAEVGIITIQ